MKFLCTARKIRFSFCPQKFLFPQCKARNGEYATVSARNQRLSIPVHIIRHGVSQGGELGFLGAGQYNHNGKGEDNGLNLVGAIRTSIFCRNNINSSLSGIFTQSVFVGISCSMLTGSFPNSYLMYVTYSFFNGAFTNSLFFYISQSQIGGTVGGSIIGRTARGAIRASLQTVMCPSADNTQIMGSFNTRDLSRLAEIDGAKTLTTNAAENAVLCWRDANNAERVEILP